MNLLLPFARRFVAGTEAADAIQAVQHLNQSQIMATLDILGESVRDRDMAIAAATAYKDLLVKIHQHKIDCNVSLKLSQMGLEIDPRLALTNLREVVITAKQMQNFVRIDMEGSKLTQKTLDIFWELRREFDNVGAVLQAYLFRSRDDLQKLIRCGGSVRLCKGAYKEPATIAWQNMRDIRNHFVELMKLLFEAVAAGKPVYPAIATHDDLLIATARKLVGEMQIPRDTFEFQMLYGLRRRLAAQLAAEGFKVRAYVPYGHDWLPYFYRRLRERKENVLFILNNLFKD